MLDREIQVESISGGGIYSLGSSHDESPKKVESGSQKQDTLPTGASLSLNEKMRGTREAF